MSPATAQTTQEGLVIALIVEGLKALPGLIREVAKGFPRYRSAREMIAASKAGSKAPPGVIYGVTVNAPEPDGKNHER